MWMNGDKQGSRGIKIRCFGSTRVTLPKCPLLQVGRRLMECKHVALPYFRWYLWNIVIHLAALYEYLSTNQYKIELELLIVWFFPPSCLVRGLEWEHRAHRVSNWWTLHVSLFETRKGSAISETASTSTVKIVKSPNTKTAKDTHQPCCPVFSSLVLVILRNLKRPNQDMPSLSKPIQFMKVSPVSPVSPLPGTFRSCGAAELPGPSELPGKKMRHVQWGFQGAECC